MGNTMTLHAQTGGNQRFFINGTEIFPHIPANNVLYLDNPCKEYTLCIQYDNWDNFGKDGKFVLNLPKGIFEIMDPGGFQVIK
jgi:hypothetical protein